MSLRITSDLKCHEIALLPLFTPYSVRHLKKEGWLNKIIGIIELFPGISLIATAIEYLANRRFKKPVAESKPIENKQIKKIESNKVAIVANKKVFMQHLTGEGHPEAPARVEAIENALRRAGLMNKDNTILPRVATEQEIALCHSKEYKQEVSAQIAKVTRPEPFNTAQRKVPYVPGDFLISPDTMTSSVYAAGAPLTAIDYILDANNKTNRAFCIARPPGHHAHQETGSGFCVFNNVAIAAKYLQEKGFKRILIVDWDAHHGDGTQTLTENNPGIFYFSTHKDTSNGFYPGRRWGQAEDKGPNCTVLNCPVSGSKEECRQGILDAFRNKLTKAMDNYKPDFVLISAGFDAHIKDSLVGLGLHDEDYTEMTNICTQIANKYSNGRIVSVLEGGYNLDAISGAAVAHVRALNQ